MEHGEDEKRCAMVGYVLKNTLSENGHVARGVCVTDERDHLVEINERTRIIKTENGAAYTEDDGQTWVDISPQSIVSMNLWGFGPGILKVLEDGFPEFLDKNLPVNPMKCEYLLPTKIGELLKKGEITVEVLKSLDKWYGVTYKEDKAEVVKALQGLKDSGLYPQRLWDED